MKGFLHSHPMQEHNADIDSTHSIVDNSHIEAAHELLEELKNSNEVIDELINNEGLSHFFKIPLKIQFKINDLIIKKLSKQKLCLK